MRLPAKPISSPARTDNFPPPLMRFLSSNAASRSSSRSRSSPLFVRKKPPAVETHEPSSPKVTCMGQVKIRKHSKRHQTPTERRCRWIPTAFFCSHFSGKIKWKGWTSFFTSETEVGGKTGKSEDGADKDGRKKGFVPFVRSTPKNAFILSRSRSAPYPSSSLANRFNGSTLMAENTEEEQRKDLENANIAKPESHPVVVSDQTVRSWPQSEEKNHLSTEGSISQRTRNSERSEKVRTGEEAEEEEEGISLSLRPLILTRSKSEPSSIAEKLNPESNSRKIGKL